MDPNVTSDRIAVLIDADNASHRQLQVVLGEVAKYGNPTIKRVYGDWTSDRLSNWAPKLNSLGLRAVHQNAFTKGKNSTDMALVIDAMDLLYDGNVESFALVTSDSDFTALTHRLRESGKAVYVLGTQKAPTSLRNACDKFIDLDVLADADDDDATEEAHDAVVPAINLQSAITRALNSVSDDDGWASLPTLGNQLVRTHPSFDPRTFAGPGARLSTLVAEQGYLETSGSGNALKVRLKGAPAARRNEKADRSAEKPADKPSDKPADKPSDRPADKPVEKTVQKTVRKRASKSTPKTTPKTAATPAEETPEVPDVVAEAPAEQVPEVKPVKKATSRRRSTAKKAAAPVEEAPAEVTAEKPARRSRTTKKSAAKTTETAAAPEQAAPPAPVVTLTTRTRGSRQVTTKPTT